METNKDLKYIQKLLRQAVFKGIIELNCPCGNKIEGEPDCEYIYCPDCNEKIMNPLRLYGYI